MDTEETVGTPVVANGRAAPGGRRIPIGIAILIVVLVAAVVAESILVFRGNGSEHDRAAVQSVSRSFLVLLTTYNQSSLADQRTKVLALATGRFKDEFEQLTGSAFSSALQQTKADSRGQIVRLAVGSVSGDSATALGVVDVTVTNKDLKTPRVDRNLIELSLVRTTKGWRVDSVTVLGKVD
jgi:Mce-associated membrane protein